MGGGSEIFAGEKYMFAVIIGGRVLKTRVCVWMVNCLLFWVGRDYSNNDGSKAIGWCFNAGMFIPYIFVSLLNPNPYQKNVFPK